MDRHHFDSEQPNSNDFSREFENIAKLHTHTHTLSIFLTVYLFVCSVAYEELINFSGWRMDGTFHVSFEQKHHEYFNGGKKIRQTRSNVRILKRWNFQLCRKPHAHCIRLEFWRRLRLFSAENRFMRTRLNQLLHQIILRFNFFLHSLNHSLEWMKNSIISSKTNVLSLWRCSFDWTTTSSFDLSGNFVFKYISIAFKSSSTFFSHVEIRRMGIENPFNLTKIFHPPQICN